MLRHVSCSASEHGFRVPCCLQTGSRLQRFLQPEGTKLGMCMAVVFCQLLGDEAGSPHLLAAYEGGHVVLWDAEQPLAPVASIRGHEEPVMALALQPSGKGGRPPCARHDHERHWLLERSHITSSCWPTSCVEPAGWRFMPKPSMPMQVPSAAQQMTSCAAGR